MTLIGIDKAAHHVVAKAHGAQNFGIALAGLRNTQPFGCSRRQLRTRLFQHLFGRQRQCQHNNGTGRRDDTKQRVQKKHEADVQRHPRHIENGNGSGTRKKSADGIDIAHRLQGFGARAAKQGQTHDGIMGLGGELAVKSAGEPDKNLRPDHFQAALENIERNRER